MDQNTSLQEISKKKKKTSHLGKCSHLKFFPTLSFEILNFCFFLQIMVGFSSLSDAKLKTI